MPMAGEIQRSAVAAQQYLTRNQQDLLAAALHSQANPLSKFTAATGPNSASQAMVPPHAMANLGDDGLYSGSHDANFDAFDVDFTPELDFLDGDESFDFDDAEFDGDLIGALPGRDGAHQKSVAVGDQKRKMSAEDDSLDATDAKRQETQEGERSSKKPGRKPLTNEPTTKRKAQNRAAQRAFRERKEKHVKDLETKVAELEKASEAGRHENGLLKAQIEKQQAELREYKKRLSMHGHIKRSPSSSAPDHNRNFSGPLGDFQFDFASFGSQSVGQQNAMLGSPANPHATIEKQDSVAPGTTRSFSRSSSSLLENQNGHGSQVAQSLSPQDTSNIGATFPSESTSNPPTYNTDNSQDFSNLLSNSNLDALFSPGLLKSANLDSYLSSGQFDLGTGDARTFTADNGGDTTAGLNRAFQFNGDSNASDTTSPSASSNSQWNANGITTSSCETSPEPYNEGPSARNKSLASNSLASPQNSLISYNTNSPNALANIQMNSTPNLGNIDYSVPSAAGFDPVLFGDYRESQAAIVGSGDFTGGFFDDALYTAPVDYSSPSSLFGILQTPQSTTFSPVSTRASTTGMPSSKSLMAEMEKARDGEESATSVKGSFISCNKIWSQLQDNPDFQDGKFDLDQLCSELRTKAKCSESGMMVPKEHVDKALAKLGSKETASQFATDHPYLTFDSNSLDDLMKKFSQ